MKNFLHNSLLFLIVAIFSLSPYNIQRLFRFPELKILKKALNNDTKIILLGSSVNKYAAPRDSDKRSISKILDEYLPKHSVTSLSHNAYHATIYLSYVKYIAKSRTKPIIIIPINLRYFSPGWDLKPTYQFTKEKFLLKDYPFFTNLKYLFNLEYRTTKKPLHRDFPVYYGNKRIGKVKDYEIISSKESDKLAEMTKGFIYHYMQPLNKNHRKLNSLLMICKTAEENNIKIVMYITPIDYMHAERLKIKNFRQQQCENITTIKSVLSSYDIELIDLSMILSSSFFHYGKRPNEHLNMYGRNKVAQALKSTLNDIVKP